RGSTSSLILRSSVPSRLDKTLLRSPTFKRISRFLTSPIVKRRTVSTYFPQKHDKLSGVPTAVFKNFPSIDDIEPAFTIEELRAKFLSLPSEVLLRCTSNRRHEGCHRSASRLPLLKDISEQSEVCCVSMSPLCCTDLASQSSFTSLDTSLDFSSASCDQSSSLEASN
ncbi:hypothetical protein FHG87_025575, partial [Trinorchestia longiramus]